MNWKFSENRPIYSQIVEEIQRRILAGIYPAGSDMPSVRQLAEEANVNPNTMQRAMAELEVQGLLYTQRTSGRTVTSDERLIMDLKDRIANGYIEKFFEGMHSLGFAPDAAIDLLTQRKSQFVQENASIVPDNISTKEVD